MPEANWRLKARDNRGKEVGARPSMWVAQVSSNCLKRCGVCSAEDIAVDDIMMPRVQGFMLKNRKSESLGFHNPF